MLSLKALVVHVRLLCSLPAEAPRALTGPFLTRALPAAPLSFRLPSGMAPLCNHAAPWPHPTAAPNGNKSESHSLLVCQCGHLEKLRC